MRERRILHVDLDPFFVSVERSLDPSLRGRPVVVGGDARSAGVVAAASSEAREVGVRPGQSLVQARALCSGAVFRAGDLATYGRFSEEVTTILLGASRRVERPSADEAYVDLTPEHAASPGPVAAVETVKDEIQRRLGLDCSLGLASSRLAARVASTWARPRGFLLVLPGYEALFLARQPLSFLPDLPPHIEACLLRAGFDTLGKVAGAEEADLVAAVGQPAAIRLRETARGEREEAVPVAAPPAWVQEESLIRDRRSDRATLQAVLEGLVRRACRRLRPFGLQAAHVTVEVRRPEGTLRRGEAIPPGANEEETLVKIVQALAEPLLEPASSARSLHVRLSRLESPGAQAPLFPGFPQVSGATR